MRSIAIQSVRQQLTCRVTPGRRYGQLTVQSLGGHIAGARTDRAALEAALGHWLTVGWQPMIAPSRPSQPRAASHCCCCCRCQLPRASLSASSDNWLIAPTSAWIRRLNSALRVAAVLPTLSVRRSVRCSLLCLFSHDDSLQRHAVPLRLVVLW